MFSHNRVSNISMQSDYLQRYNTVVYVNACSLRYGGAIIYNM